MPLPLPPGIPASNVVIMLGLETSPPTYAAVANLGDFAGPSQSATTVDVSKHGDKFRRFVETLIDTGTVTMPCWFDPSVPTLAGNADAISELFKSRQLRTWLMAFVDDAGIITEAILQFNAYVSKFSMKFPVAGVWSADVEFRTDGEAVYLWATTTPPTGQPLP